MNYKNWRKGLYYLALVLLAIHSTELVAKLFFNLPVEQGVLRTSVKVISCLVCGYLFRKRDFIGSR